MDRIIVYPGAIPLDTDMLNTNRNTMTALHALISATLGTVTTLDGLNVAATVPPSMNVTVSQGSITQFAPMDATGYGSLGVDTADTIMKMGVLLDPAVLTLTAPTTAGTAVVYLVEAAFSEVDVDPVVLPYYNAANPAAPYLGPGNTGAAQATLRQQLATLQLKAGAPAPTGYAVAPPVDVGWQPLATVLVNAGATQITSVNIVASPATRFAEWKLPDLRPGFAFASAFTSSGVFVVPPQTTRLKLTVIGGGGAGGTHATLPGGGGAAGGRGEQWLAGLVPGTAIPVTVGGPGAPASGAGNGGPGGTSSFGSYVSATGGQGGGGGSGSATPLGGFGGVVFGASVYYFGGYGGDAFPSSGRGGDGAGPGNGKGGSSGATGTNATGVGGGGGGGSTGVAGGAGAGGVVIVEY